MKIIPFRKKQKTVLTIKASELDLLIDLGYWIVDHKSKLLRLKDLYKGNDTIKITATPVSNRNKK